MLKPEDYIEFRKQWDENKRNYEKAHPEEFESSRKFNAEIRTKQARGEIVDPFVRNWMNGQITEARWILFIGIILTALIKGQIVLWAIMYFAYRGRVKKVKEDALKTDREHYDFAYKD